MNEDVHHDQAQKWLNLSETTYSKGSAIATAGEAAVYSIAHAVLALIDYLQQDDTEVTAAGINQMSAENMQIKVLERQRDGLAEHVRQLKVDLEAARAALRRRETITAAEMKNVNWSPPDG